MRKIKVLVAPNAFKGSMNAIEVAKSIENGLLNYDLFETGIFPIADGGDGTLEILLNRLGGQFRMTKAQDPLGREINAAWGTVDHETAVIEMANASGIKLLKKGELDPSQANTFGTGQLILSAIEHGCRSIVLGIGGSATVDAGTGLLKALGARFFDKKGNEIKSGNFILDAVEIDLKGCLKKLEGIKLTILSDVDNHLLGERGAARVFGPQKGADDHGVIMLERAMEKFSDLIINESKQDHTKMKGAGAAGGIAFTLRSLFNAEVIGGMDYLIEQTDLMDQVKWSDVVITGEGKIDLQTLEGKGPAKVAGLAKEDNKICIGICGVYEWDELMSNYFDMLLPINQGMIFNEKMLNDNPRNLERTARQFGHLLVAIIDLKARSGIS